MELRFALILSGTPSLFKVTSILIGSPTDMPPKHCLSSVDAPWTTLVVFFYSAYVTEVYALLFGQINHLLCTVETLINFSRPYLISVVTSGAVFSPPRLVVVTI